MPNLSLDTVAVLARIAFLVAAVTDALALIPMLLPRVGTAMFGGDSSRDTAQFRYAMNLAAALMVGWTALLFWGAAEPIERRGVLLIVVFPIIGIVSASVAAARRGVIQARRMVPIWIHLAALSVFCLFVHALSCKAVA